MLYPHGRPVHEDPRDDAAHGLDRHLDIPDRPAVHVEQPPLDHLLGSERDVGGRLVGVGIELDPAGAVAGRHRDGAEPVMPGRRGALGVDPEAAGVVAPRLADRGGAPLVARIAAPRLLDRRVDHHRRARLRLAVGIEHAADDEHPARGRPVSRRRRGPATTAGAWRGSSPLASDRRQIAAAGSQGRPGTASRREGRLSLWIVMARSTSWARVVAVEAAACRAAKRIAARAVRSHRWGETDAEATEHGAASAAAGSTPRRVRARRSFSRARARRLRSVPAGHAEPAGRLVERQALEVAEHDRRAEGVRQPVDLAVQHLGLLAVEERLLGRRGRRLDAIRWRP